MQTSGSFSPGVADRCAKANEGSIKKIVAGGGFLRSFQVFVDDFSLLYLAVLCAVRNGSSEYLVMDRNVIS